MPRVPYIDKYKLNRTARAALQDGWRLRGNVESVLQNGVGRYVCQLQRLTIAFCKTTPGSAGVRDFIENEVVDFANDNPGVVVYLEPKRNKQPYMIAEYLNGRQVHQHLSGMTRDEMNRWVNYMRTRSGQRIVSLDRMWKTDSPSIQGMWTPFLNDPTDAQCDGFPNQKHSRFQNPKHTATDTVLELIQNHQLDNLRISEPEQVPEQNQSTSEPVEDKKEASSA